MISIKICGIKTARDYELLAQLSVDWVGLVFYPKSPRYLTFEQATLLPDYGHKGLKDYGHKGLKRVGLFVEPSKEEIERVLGKVRLDILQLYTSVENAFDMQKTFQLPVWLAKGIKEKADLPTLCPVDGLVIEAPPSKEDSRPGGNNKSFDWRLTKDWQSPKPWILAGGLNDQNVKQAIMLSGTKAVDVSSGVEKSLGVKSPELIKRFVNAARDCD